MSLCLIMPYKKLEFFISTYCSLIICAIGNVVFLTLSLVDLLKGSTTMMKAMVLSDVHVTHVAYPSALR